MFIPCPEKGDGSLFPSPCLARLAVDAGLKTLLQNEEDPHVQIWTCVRLGGERPKDLVPAFGYADPSGIHRVVQRLEARSKRDPGLANRLRILRSRAR